MVWSRMTVQNLKVIHTYLLLQVNYSQKMLPSSLSWFLGKEKKIERKAHSFLEPYVPWGYTWDPRSRKFTLTVAGRGRSIFVVEYDHISKN
jgi:hypothetical protein